MFEVRKDEPDYAFIPNTPVPELNQYGDKIQLANDGNALAGKSLNINGDNSIGENPNRYKQHGFYFNADNCIACHACESACSEKNNLPPYLAYRSVGYIEGGTYPNYTRLNISMACNHCDDPVCLKGCPTRAYTKFAEYGAVLQDPDICFGCGYCTWVCPYNAPQLDMEQGHVHKCNMCVDRLEVGLKPACVAACLAGALDFGVIETLPENRDQLQTQIPGFPSPEITHPNIRFQQTKSLPREMTRPDSMPLRYERDAQGQGGFNTKVRDTQQSRQWNLQKLNSRENPLVFFTLMSQTVIGAFLLLFLGPQFGLNALSIAAHPVLIVTLLMGLITLQTFALVLSTIHLGKPQRFYRGFYNLRYSPVSREAASLMVFFASMALYTGAVLFGDYLNWLPLTLVQFIKTFSGWAGVAFGLATLYFMQRIYRIPARPFWNHWQVLASFYGSMLTLGSILVGTVYGAVLLYQGHALNQLFDVVTLCMLVGLLLECVGLVQHARAMRRQGGEGGASLYEQTTTFGKTYILRNTSLSIGVMATTSLFLLPINSLSGYLFWLLIAAMILVTAIVSRALFYVLVIPTTMPGAFFWKNRGFQEHASATGLADMPQVGVLPNKH